jgi:translocation and assembly module TamB
LATFFVVVEVLQSEATANNLSAAINKVIENKYNTKVEIEKLEFQLFPPGILAKNVSVESEGKGYKVNLRSYVLGAFIDVRDIFQKKPTLSEILIADSKIKIEIKSSKEEKSDELESIEVDNIIKTLNDMLPINLIKINLNKAAINFNNSDYRVEKLILKKRSRSIKINASVFNLDLRNFTNYDRLIDEINTTVVLDKNKISVKDLDIKNGVTSIQGKGSLANNFKAISGNFSIDLESDIAAVHDYVDLEKIGKLNYGSLRLKSKVIINNDDFKTSNKIVLNNFLTDFCYGDSLQAQIDVNTKEVKFNNFKLIKERQSLELLKPFQFYDFRSNKFVEDIVSFKTNKLQLKNALYFLRENLSILDASISGGYVFKLDKTGFLINSNQISFEQLRLGKGTKPIVGVPVGSLDNANFILDGNNFRMSTNIKLPNTELSIVGEIGKDKLSFRSNKGEVDFNDFERFAGFDVKGRGELSLEVNNEKGNVIKLNPNLRDFSFEGYNLSSVKSELSFELDNSLIKINQIEAEQGKAEYKGSALLNYETLDVNSKISIYSRRFVDIKKTLNPLIGNISYIPDDIYGEWRMETSISGRATPKDIVVKNYIRGDNNYIFDESFEQIKLKLNFEKEQLSFRDVYLKKSVGNIKGKFLLDFKKDSFDYDFKLTDVPIKELNIVDKSPFDLEAYVNGEFKGSKSKKSSKIESSLNLKRTYIAGRRVRDSLISSKIEDGKYQLDVNLFGGEFLLASNLFEDNKKQSKIKWVVNTQDIPLYFSMFKFVDKSTLNMVGGVRLSSEVDFPGFNYNKANFGLLLSEFIFKKDRVNIDYRYRSSNPQFQIDNGVVKNWDLELEGRKFYFISKGSGDLKKKYDIANSFKVDASILETFNKVISKSNGTIRGKLNFNNDGSGQDYDATIVSNNLSFSTSLLPTEVKNTKLLIEYENKTLLVKNLNAVLSAGDVSLTGTIGISNVVPEFNLRLKVNEAGFPVLRKSNVVISGNTTIIGTRPPYTIAGDININKLLIVNDINDFTTGKDAIIKKQFDYLPAANDKRFDNFVNFNLNLTAKEPMRISNSFADVGMVGDLQLLGGDSDPKLVGSLELAPRVNKITFKNNEYILSKGNVFFYQQNKIQNPELDFIASSTINDYKINLKLYGPVKNFQLDLTSTPALAQEDVLSLIAFGYTKDLSANLTDAERESMTQAGVGSILFDSFKINETLKSEFGLQVNLGTQIQQNETSLLNQRNADSTRVRSATTIEVKKKLSEAMSLSVSSTVGGSAGQRQSMNLNYNISNKVSVEGVYETRTAPEGEEAIINDTSLGADVKVRWSFK